jgi:hypothetical protein
MVNAQARDLLDTRELGRTFIEPAYERPIRIHSMCRVYPYLVQQALYMQVEPTFGPSTGMEDRSRLRKYTELVLDVEGREKVPKPQPLDGKLERWLRALYIINNELRDWDALYRNTAGLIEGLRVLPGTMNRQEREEWDRESRGLVERVVADCLPSWTWDVLAALGLGKAQWSRVRTQALMPHDPHNALLLRELRRLYKLGVLGYERPKWFIQDPVVREMVSTRLA